MLRGAWWEMFDDPQLSALASRVTVSNETLKAAQAQYQQARALVEQARAAYFPVVTIGAGVSRTRRSANLGSGSFSTPSLYSSSYTLPFDVAWEPDIWGKVRRSVESNQASAQSSAAMVESTQLSLQAELAVNYFQVRQLDALEAVLNATVEAYERSLQLTRNRYNAGVASAAEVAQAQTQLQSTRAQAIDVGVQRAQLEHAIAVLVGEPASTFALPAAPLDATPPAIPVGVPSELLERRPDVAAAERSMAAANAQIGVALAAYYPVVTLSASGGLQAGEPATWFETPSRFWSVGPTITETVFDGGLRGGLTDQARAIYDQAVAQYRQSVLTAFAEVEDNLATLRILEQEAQVQDEAVASARRSVELTTNQYKAGIVSYIDVVTVQAVALANERAAVSIRGQRMGAAVQLVKALGGGWDTSQLPQPY